MSHFMRKFWPQCTYFVHDKGIGKSMGDNRITEIHIYFGKLTPWKEETKYIYTVYMYATDADTGVELHNDWDK